MANRTTHPWGYWWTLVRLLGSECDHLDFIGLVAIGAAVARGFSITKYGTSYRHGYVIYDAIDDWRFVVDWD